MTTAFVFPGQGSQAVGMGKSLADNFAAARAVAGPFGDLHFSPDEIREIRYASLLHDFGKVGVREHVLVKAKKLYPGDLERIGHRVELLKRDLSLRTARAKLDRALAHGAPPRADPPAGGDPQAGARAQVREAEARSPPAGRTRGL